MDRPSADWHIDEALVRGLLRDQVPSIADAPLRALGHGWDNAMYQLGAHRLVRLPRREPAVSLIHHEQRWLKQLSSLPLPIPIPIHAGRPTAEFPHPWSVLPFVRGGSWLRSPPSELTPAAIAMGGFLRALHQPAPVGLHRNPFRGVPLLSRDTRVHDACSRLGSRVDPAVLDVWRELRDLAPGEDTWVHGDLHADNVLTRAGRVVSVIDFGDIGRGDPAVDLSFGWMVFDADSRRRFFDSAGADDRAQQRARGWALALALTYIETSDDDPPFQLLAMQTLARCLERRACAT